MSAEDDTKITSPKRLESVEHSGLLDSPRVADYDRITDLVRRLLGADVVLLSIVSADRQFFKSASGLPAALSEVRETPLSHSFCKHVVAAEAPLVIDDSKQDERVACNPSVEELGVAAYLGVPVRAPDGEVLGSLCAISRSPRRWSEDSLANLEKFGAIVEAEIRLRDIAIRASRLAEENAILAREYHHRVKNTMAVSAALVTMSGREADTVAEVVERTRSRLNALAQAHDALESESDAVDLGDLAARLLLPYCLPGSVADVAGPSVALRQRQVTPICFFFHELATNSAKYGAFAEGGAVQVRWALVGEGVALTWDERSRSIAPVTGSGFGSTLIKVAATQIHGALAVDWSEGGLVVRLDFPRA